MILQLCEFLKFPEWRKVPVIKPLWEHFLSFVEVSYIKNAKIPEHPLNSDKRDEKVIVSLTSFPARIDIAAYSIKSLMLQTYKPDRIQLWLASEQFVDCPLPDALIELQKYGLEILWCEEDLRGHKKYYQPIKDQKEDELVITYDDDIIYPLNSIELLMREHRKFPRAVICNRGWEIAIDDDNHVKERASWSLRTRHGVREEVSVLHISNGYGVLFPYNSLYKDATNPSLIRQYGLSVDDFWITVMTVLQHTKIVKTVYRNKEITTFPGSQSVQLYAENQKRADNVNRYDVALKNLTQYYPELEGLLVVRD